MQPRSEAHTFLFVDGLPQPDKAGRRSPHDKSAILSHAQARRRAREKLARKPTPPEDRDLASRLIRTYPSDNSLDPFYSTVVGVDGRVLASIANGLAHAESSTFLAESFAPKRVMKSLYWPITEALLERLQQCVTDPLLMYSTLAFGSSYVGWISGRLESLEAPELYMAKALPSVQTRTLDLRGPPSIWLLLAIHDLAVTELWNGIPELWLKCPPRASMADARRLHACRTHLRAMCSFVQHVGGWSEVQLVVLKAAVMTDKFLSLYTLDPPVIPLTWDPGPRVPTDAFHRFSLMPGVASFGNGLACAPQSETLRGIVQDMNDYVQQACFAWEEGVTPPLDESKWLFLRLQALIYRLLLLKDSTQKDECIRLATLVFLLRSTEYSGAQISATMLLQHLRTAVIYLLHVKPDSTDKILFWCVCTGAMASEVSNTREWFLERVVVMTYDLNVPITFDDFEKYLESVLFLGAKQTLDLVKLLEAISPSAESSNRGVVSVTPGLTPSCGSGSPGVASIEESA